MITVPSMSPADFMRALDFLGLKTDSAAARALGCTPRAIRFWKAGERKVPGPVVVLLSVLQSMRL